jgi:hypothetical protein
VGGGGGGRALLVTGWFVFGFQPFISIQYLYQFIRNMSVRTVSFLIKGIVQERKDFGIAHPRPYPKPPLF